MTRQEVIQEQIDEVMDCFDFCKVAEYMKQTNWTWATTDNYVPDEQQLRQSVRNTMKQLAKTGTIGQDCGGFYIEFIENKSEKWLRFDVRFTIETWNIDGISYTD